jgi:hypothetical protein
VKEIVKRSSSLLLREFMLQIVDSWSSQQRDFLSNLCWILAGKWDSLRDCVVEKGIPFLGLCRLRGKRDW